MKQELRNYAVLWDMDGTLVDTGNFHYLSWKQTFNDLGISFELEDFKKTFGMNNAGILEWFYESKPKPDEIKRIGNKKEILFRELVRGKTELLPGYAGYLLIRRTF